jgi:hypothetical protein
MKISKRRISLAVFLCLSFCFANLTFYSSSGQGSTLPAGAPIFSSADQVVPNLNLNLESNGANPVPAITSTSEILDCYYTRPGSGTASSILIHLRIAYYFSAADAKSGFDVYSASVVSDFNSVQQDSSVVIYENKFEENYSSVIFEQLPSLSYESSVYYVNRAIYGGDSKYSGDPKIVIVVDGHGNGFADENEIKQISDKLTQHALTVIGNAPRSGQPVVTPTPTPEPLLEQFKVQWVQGNVQIKYSGAIGWVPATSGMTIHEGDRIWARGDLDPTARVRLYYKGQRSDTGSYYGASEVDHTLFLKGSSDLTVLPYSKTHGDEVSLLMGYILAEAAATSSQSSNPSLTVKTPDGQVADQHTKFEVIVDDYGTTVNTFEGTVQVSDIDGINSVYAGADQTVNVPLGGLPSSPQTFDPATMDQWWTSFPPVSDLNPQGTSLFGDLLPFIIIIIVVIVVAVIVVIIYASRGRQAHTQPPTAQFPPPPPVCPTCGQPLQWVPQYQRYWCNKEQKYV